MAPLILFLQKCLKINWNSNKPYYWPQQSGFAETDPTLDIEGYDALNKWSILLNHSYGIVERPGEYCFHRNTKTSIKMMQWWQGRKHYEIKLVAQAKKT